MYPDLEEPILTMIDKLQLKRFLRLNTTSLDISSVVKLLNTNTLVVVISGKTNNAIDMKLKAEFTNTKIILFRSMKLKPDEVLLAY